MTEPDELELNAYCDGELSPIATIEFERRLVQDKSLRARYVRLLSLRRAIRAIPQSEMPLGLQGRVNSRLDRDRAGHVGRTRQRRWSFQALAAAAVLGAVISSSVMLVINRYDLREEVANQVVAGHIRSLLATQPFDVVSSDRYTVRPWFKSHLAASPRVPDCARMGFILVGGRLDVVGYSPVATIVYKHEAHTISLTALPLRETFADQTIAGYNTRSWSDAEFVYVAVSDLPEADLATFEHAFSEGSLERELPHEHPGL
jgi:anti-sigma factor RsiW